MLLNRCVEISAWLSTASSQISMIAHREMACIHRPQTGRHQPRPTVCLCSRVLQLLHRCTSIFTQRRHRRAPSHCLQHTIKNLLQDSYPHGSLLMCGFKGHIPPIWDSGMSVHRHYVHGGWLWHLNQTDINPNSEGVPAAHLSEGGGDSAPHW